MNTLLSLLFAFFAALAFGMPFEILNTAEIAARMPEGTVPEKISAFLPVFGERVYPQAILLFPLLFFVIRALMKRIHGRRFSLAALILALVYSGCLICGECGLACGTMASLFSNMPQCLMTGIRVIGFAPFFYLLTRAGFAAIDEMPAVGKLGRLPAFIFERHSFLLPLCIILVCWLPTIIAFYPGFVPSDGLKQLNNFFGSGNFTDNHPAFSSMLMGWAMKLGRRLGSDNLGLFLFTGSQALINALVMAACFPMFRRLKSPVWLRWLTLADFALVPIWSNYAYSLLKDSLYMAMILLFCLQLIAIILDAEDFCAKAGGLVLMTFSLTLMTLVRHEGQYVAALVFLTLFTLPGPRRQWKKLLPVLLIPLLIVNVFNRVIRPKLGIADAPAREALTMPFRQTAAVIIHDEESINEEQSAVLRELFDYDKIASQFSVETADELKGLFDPWAEPERIAAYLKVWAELGLTHPLTYLDVFLSSNTRYYDPFAAPHRDIYGWYGIETETHVNKGLFDLHYDGRTAALRSVLTNLADACPRLPLISLFYSLGLNAWVLMFCLANLLRRNVRGVIIPLLPALITFVMLQNSAINGFFRYMLPMMITLPLCFKKQ